MSRNSTLLAIYIGALSLADSRNGMSPGHVPTDSNPHSTVLPGLCLMEVAEETLAAVESFHGGSDNMGESFGLDSHPYRL